MAIIEAKNQETAEYLDKIGLLGIWRYSNDGQHVFRYVNGKIVETITIGEYLKRLMES